MDSEKDILEESQDLELDEPYILWNTRVALFWLTKPCPDAVVYLTVTPRGLAAALWECDGRNLDSEAAEQDFIDTVRSFYKRRVLAVDENVGCLAQMASSGGAPLCVAFLAFSVLAAYRMRADGKHSANAYYVRLAELLACEVHSDLPAGFSKQSFELLWKYVRTWMSVAGMTPLFIPNTDVVQRYIAYPLAHTALRQVDLDRLPTFFEWANYGPGTAVAPDCLHEDFRRWLSEGEQLTKQGLAACKDSRLDIVLQEVAQELKCWDGVAHDNEGRIVANVELVLDIIRGMPRLAYLARKPPGFPDVFDDEDNHHFDSFEEGWYDPVTVARDDGRLLIEGFDWISRRCSPNVVLRRAGCRAIAFVRSDEYTGWTSRRRLLAGVSCAVLYHETVKNEVEHRVLQLTGSSKLNTRTDSTLPKGWYLLPDVRIDMVNGEIIPGLEALEVDSAVEIMTVGGLRIGLRAAWLLGSAPKLIVSGTKHEVKVDRRPVKVRSDGFVQWDHLCRSSGNHVIEAARSCRRIELVQPELATGLLSIIPTELDDVHVVSLPVGRWTLVGREFRHVAYAEHYTSQKIVTSPFKPIWAILGGRKGYALFLDHQESILSECHTSNLDATLWAQAVTHAFQSNIQLACLDASACAMAYRSWRSYVCVAREALGRMESKEQAV